MINRVGQRLLQLFEGASAAYSLRDLASNIASVVRVRRASDNSEKDFSAADVSSGAMTQWVNAQIVPPLDVRELVDGERTGALIPAAAAYSLRNLSTSYTGDVVDVRRSSDNAEDSFTAAEVADGTLVTWVGAGNDGFVALWYDQSGNDNHAIQSAPPSQPKIVDAGVLVSGNTGEPAFRGDGVDDILSLSSSIDFGTGEFFVSTAVDVGTGGVAIGSGSNWLLLVTPSSIQVRASNTRVVYVISTDSAFTAGESYLISLSRVGNDITAYVNGVAQADVETVVSTDTFSADRFLQRGINNNPYSNPVSEVIIYNSDQSDNRTAFEANIGETYGIDLPSGVDTGYDQVDGFVETWYDQSGNGNDAVQETAGSQPKIVDAGVLVTDRDGKIALNGKSARLAMPSNAPMLSSDGTYSLFAAVDLPDQTLGNDTFNDFIKFESSGSGGASASRKPLWSIGGGSGQLNCSTPSFSGTGGSTNATFTETKAAQLLTNICNPALSTGNNLLYNSGSLIDSSDTATEVNTQTLTGFSARLFDLQETTVETFLSEVIYYPSDQSANRVAIETNINNQYDIY